MFQFFVASARVFTAAPAVRTFIVPAESRTLTVT